MNLAPRSITSPVVFFIIPKKPKLISDIINLLVPETTYNKYKRKHVTSKTKIYSRKLVTSKTKIFAYKINSLKSV